jgi:hypothetical protein
MARMCAERHAGELLHEMAQQIRDRALRRGGELLLQVKAQGERSDKLS